MTDQPATNTTQPLSGLENSADVLPKRSGSEAAGPGGEEKTYPWVAANLKDFYKWTADSFRWPDDKVDSVVQDILGQAPGEGPLPFSIIDAKGACVAHHCNRFDPKIRAFCDTMAAYTTDERELVRAAALSHVPSKPKTAIAVDTPFVPSADDPTPPPPYTDIQSQIKELRATVALLRDQLTALSQENAALRETVNIQQLALKQPLPHRLTPRPEEVAIKTIVQRFAEDQPETYAQNDKAFSELVNAGWQIVPNRSHGSTVFTITGAHHYLITTFQRPLNPPTATIDAAIQAALSARPDPDQPILRQRDLRTPDAVVESQPDPIATGGIEGGYLNLLRTGFSLDEIKDAADQKALATGLAALKHRRPAPIIQLIPGATQ